MTAPKRLCETEVRAVGRIDICIKVVAAGVVIGRKEVGGKGRAAGNRVEGVIGGGASQTVAVLQERVLFATNVDGVDRGRANGRRRDRGRSEWSEPWGGHKLVGETPTGVEILLCHLGLEQRAFLSIDPAPVEHISGLESFLMRAKLCKTNLWGMTNRLGWVRLARVRTGQDKSGQEDRRRKKRRLWLPLSPWLLLS